VSGFQMGLIDPTHLLIVAIVALIVIGPRRLPEVARALGRAAHEFRAAMNEGLAGAEDGPSTASERDAALSAPEHRRA
jgi:sec-independent protein translocase protein TatA